MKDELNTVQVSVQNSKEKRPSSRARKDMKNERESMDREKEK